MAGIQLEASCKLCGFQGKKASMTKHLQKCSSEHPSSAKAKTRAVYHLRAENTPYWIDLELAADARFDDLDGALRGIWLECCGHMSSFELKAKSLRIENDDEMDGWNGVRTVRMTQKLDKWLEKGDVLEYKYDFGSTTTLKLKVIEQREAPLDTKTKVRLLARNLPPTFSCEVCSGAATQTCGECYLDLERGWRPQYFCEAHAEEHVQKAHMGDNYSMYTVWNSPRDGVCGYHGSEADEKPYLHSITVINQILR